VPHRNATLSQRLISRSATLFPFTATFAIALLLVGPDVRFAAAAPTDDACLDCHDTSEHEASIAYGSLLETSIHAGFACVDCHTAISELPHAEEGMPPADCGSCHGDVVEEYRWHGGEPIPGGADVPTCADCHGRHSIKASSDSTSMTHRTALTTTCAGCHGNIDLVRKHEILNQAAVELYKHSIHGSAVAAGSDSAATCIDCHGSGGSAHRILLAGDPASSINHFNIPATCGTCHSEIAEEYWQGVHGKLVKRGEVGSPVCTDCHGEHGIISPTDRRSPVSASRVAEATCSPCHESASLNEKYIDPTGRPTSWVDTYHGLKSQFGDALVANCSSCHGAHRILPSSDSLSSVHPANLQATCGSCHPSISSAMANTTVHGDPRDNTSPAAGVVGTIYLITILLVIGGMVFHGVIDYGRHIKAVRSGPQVRRMKRIEVAQHWVLMISFIVLVITGFGLRYPGAWWTRLLFGWEGGFPVRGTIHRISGVVLIASSLWHLFYLFTPRGKQFIRDMGLARRDLTDFIAMVRYNLGGSRVRPSFGRFSYVEKTEYWALIWGTVIMAITGLLLWFDNAVVQFLPRWVLEVSLVAHFYEAILASLAILVWHLYSTVFSPSVYPMNPSWLDGKMPDAMYRHEHAEDAAGAMRLEVESEVGTESAISRRSWPCPGTRPDTDARPSRRSP